MNIKEAKQQIANAMKAYFTKDEFENELKDASNNQDESNKNTKIVKQFCVFCIEYAIVVEFIVLAIFFIFSNDC